MNKTYSKTLLGILFACVASAASAQVGSFTYAGTTKASGKTVSKILAVTLDYYMAVSFTDGTTNMTMTIADGGGSSTYTSSIPTFSLSTNASTTMTPSISVGTTPNGWGTWSAQVSKDGTTYSASAVTVSAAATATTCYLEVILTKGAGLTMATAPVISDTTTTVTVTFAQP